MGPPPEIDAAWVARLVAAQFPHWADLPVHAVPLGGHDNRTFRLGDALLARLPSRAAYAARVPLEHAWLPRLAPHLPLPIPPAVALGAPGEGYDWPWAIRGWLAGEPVSAAPEIDAARLASDLAGFLNALHGIDPADGPPAGPETFHRGGRLEVYDGETRAAIAALGADIDAVAASRVWDEALAAEWRGPAVWFHGDVAAGNLLVREGRLSAVIDFGQFGVGDPACDLAIAWTLFEGEGRRAFRGSVRLDAGCWARGRGWALWKGLITCARGEPTQAAGARWTVDQVLADPLGAGSP